MLEQWTAKLTALSGEFLFFVGATYLAVLLLRSGRRVSSAIAFGAGVLWLTFHLPVSLYLESLGADSFAETKGFNLDEAFFWLQTLGSAIQPIFSPKKFFAYLAVSLLSFYLLKKLLERPSLSPRAHFFTKLSISLVLIVVAVQITVSNAVAAYIGNSELFVTAAKNFANEAPEVSLKPSQANLVVYIGESTTAMNMGLYGYPRQTTPLLSERARKDENLIVFRDVFSTHTHTSGSLLEALSLPLERDQEFLPINKRRRLSLVEVLNKGGIDTRLFSNQALDGSWSQVASVIFKNSRNVIRGSKQDTSSAPVSRWDDEFFERQLNTLDLERATKRRAVFLHSYAGHGRYYANIPERFRQPVDQALSQLQRSQILEDPTQSVDAVQEYDAAIKYVDYSVEKVIDRVQRSSQPTIFVYFSDHGEAVYGGRGHDSARFKHEMVRVPLLIYFNPAAKQASPALYGKYRALAEAQEPATLAQLSATLLDLMGVGLKNPSGATAMPLIGESTRLPPILVRETAEGTTYLNVNAVALSPPAHAGRKLIDKTDQDTKTYAAIRAHRIGSDLCKATPLSLEERSRNILLADCPNTALLGARLSQ